MASTENEYRLLVVDDAPDVAAGLVDVCTKLGRLHGVKINGLTAKSATAALQVLGATPVDILVLDQDLGPGMTGSDLIDLIRPFNGVVAMLSGLEVQELRDTWIDQLERGRTLRFIRKPVDDVILEAFVLSSLAELRGRPLPTPLAVAHKALSSPESSLAGVMAAGAWAEAVARFLTLVSMAGDPEAVLPTLAGKPMSAGGWIERLRKSWRDGDLVAWAPSLKGASGKRLLTVLSEVVAIRNNVAHGPILPEPVYKRKLEALSQRIAEITNFIDFLRRGALISATAKGVVGDDGSASVEVLMLMGDETRFSRNHISAPESPLVTGRVYLTGTGFAPRALHPFFILTTCDKCERLKLQEYQGHWDGRNVYKGGCPHEDGEQGGGHG